MLFPTQYSLTSAASYPKTPHISSIPYNTMHDMTVLSRLYIPFKLCINEFHNNAHLLHFRLHTHSTDFQSINFNVPVVFRSYHSFRLLRLHHFRSKRSPFVPSTEPIIKGKGRQLYQYNRMLSTAPASHCPICM